MAAARLSLLHPQTKTNYFPKINSEDKFPEDLFPEDELLPEDEFPEEKLLPEDEF